MPKPLGYQVSIEMDTMKEAKIGSLYITEASMMKSDEASEIGTVLELGPIAFQGLAKGESKEPWVKPGDRVYVKAYGGRRFKYKSGRHIRVVNDEDISVGVSPEDETDELV